MREKMKQKIGSLAKYYPLFMQKHEKYRTAVEEIENQYVISADCPLVTFFY